MVFKKLYCFIITILISVSLAAPDIHASNDTNSTKKERNHITTGNNLYNDGKYKEAMTQYKLALEENPSSVIARYNLALSEIRLGSNVNDTTQSAKMMLDAGTKGMQQISNLGSSRPLLASRANYNLGNIAFNSQDFPGAVNYYKQALRLNPNDNDARRNLRIAQLKIQNQDENQDQNQNQEENQDQQEQDQQDQNQDQEQNNQDQQDQDQQQQQNQPQSMNQQTIEQILNAMENKENHTRARVAGANAEKSRQRNRNKLNW